MSSSTHRARALAALALILASGCSSSEGEYPLGHEPALAQAAAALSAAQCDYFAVNGKVRICHATGSRKNPYTVLNVSENSCVDGHALHAGDYVAINDPTCGGEGFLPPGAPCDPTLACSVGFTCRDAVCAPTDLCAGVQCTAVGQCEVAFCDPGTGQCVTEDKVDDFPCDDGDGCTQTDTCQGGSCEGADPIVCTARDVCHVAGVCDPQSGACSNPSVADHTACGNGDACTMPGVCLGGVCEGMEPVRCPGLDACNVDYTCSPASGDCVPTLAADGTACDDNDETTSGDRCTQGVCAGVVTVACPCFTAETMQAAWDAVQEAILPGRVTDYNEPYKWCQDKTLTYGDGTVQTHTQMQFYEFSGFLGTTTYWARYVSRDGNFLGLTYTNGTAAVCMASLGGVTYDVTTTPNHIPFESNYQIYQAKPADPITPAQADACKDLIHTFAAQRGIVCESVTVP